VKFSMAIFNPLAAATIAAAIASIGFSAIANSDDPRQSRHAAGGECSNADVTTAYVEYKAAAASRITAAYSGVVQSGAASSALLLRKLDNAYRGCRQGETITMPRFLVQRRCDLTKAIATQAGDEVSCVQK
jgi:hypothetical protein